MRTAVRDVIRHCIYGVDLNPLAVELCKVALWLEAHVPGDPASGWVHVSIARGRAPRGQLLTATPKGSGRPGMLYQSGLPG
jgi:hypothetical protein